MQLHPYLFFPDTCEEALEFYARVFDGKLTHVSRFGDMPPDPNYPIPEGRRQKIMHARLDSNAVKFMASDGREGAVYPSGNVSLSLSFTEVPEGEAVYEALSEGGNIEMPLADMFWGAKFANFTDRFGIDWMINIELAPAAT